MMKIAIIGFGAIGKYVFDNLKKEKIFITSLICRPGREEAAREVLKSNLEIYNSIDQYREYPDLILDCAGHSSLIDYATDALCRGINFITLSSGALADDKLFNKIKKSEVKGKSKLIIASGAIGSLDILTSAKNKAYRCAISDKLSGAQWSLCLICAKPRENINIRRHSVANWII